MPPAFNQHPVNIPATALAFESHRGFGAGELIQIPDYSFFAGRADEGPLSLIVEKNPMFLFFGKRTCFLGFHLSQGRSFEDEKLPFERLDLSIAISPMDFSQIRYKGAIMIVHP